MPNGQIIEEAAPCAPCGKTSTTSERHKVFHFSDDIFVPENNIVQTAIMESCTAIILLCQNDLRITKKCLESIYKHTDDFSIIFIDNASSDGSFNFLKKFAENKDNFILVRNEEDNGCIGGRNLGYRIFCELNHKSEYIVFLDNDQLVSKDWLKRHIALVKHGYDIVGAEAWLIGSTLLPTRHNMRLDQAFSYVGCGGMLIKREVIEDIGLFDESFGKSFFEDPDFCFRAREAGYKIGWNIKHGIKHEQQASVMTSNEDKRIPSMLQPHLDIFDK